jgi:hypothetical protein
MSLLIVLSISKEQQLVYGIKASGVAAEICAPA